MPTSTKDEDMPTSSTGGYIATKRETVNPVIQIQTDIAIMDEFSKHLKAIKAQIKTTENKTTTTGRTAIHKGHHQARRQVFRMADRPWKQGNLPSVGNLNYMKFLATESPSPRTGDLLQPRVWPFCMKLHGFAGLGFRV